MEISVIVSIVSVLCTVIATYLAIKGVMKKDLEDKFADFKKDMNEGFTKLDKKFDKLDSQVDALRDRVTRLETLNELRKES